ncbi:MFS transporter [Acinetobacter shaoyimingii]|uniref:MFS transporter n=1 Tax=Acinetobacter shaoyimingii TaxID=2715164 RepID=A0A6G8RRP6_9GAMM|nr:MFS transporter [Acinetobacter shaoyimingii]QIO04458.1 MFS transporter [Acinetobacter shaoyimingii]
MNFSAWRPFITVSLALCIGTIGTALASPLYPLYQALWQLLPSDITYLFVAYMFGCMTTLLFLGRTSNSIGYIRTLQTGLCVAIAGLSLSVIAEHTLVLGIGRFIIGIASGLISTSAMLGLIYTIPDSHKQNAAQISSIITVIGFGLGPFVGGSIAQFSKYPLVTPYLPIIILASVSFISLFFIQAKTLPKQSFSIAPHLEAPEHQFKPIFYIASFTAFCAFAGFSLFASLAPSFIRDIIPWHGPLVSGMTISSILLVSAVAQFFARSKAMHPSLNIGLITLILSFILLTFCMIFHWSLLFFISVILVGWGHGYGLIGAFSVIQKITTDHNRAAVVSTYLFIAYLGTILPIVSVGYIADHFGFTAGIVSFSMVMGLLCLYLFMRHLKIELQFKALIK